MKQTEEEKAQAAEDRKAARAFDELIKLAEAKGALISVETITKDKNTQS